VIDTHCHLLPGLDDGSRNAAQALALGQRLVAAGVRKVVCTPHFSRRYPTDHDRAGAALETLVAEFARADVGLELALAAEVGSAAAAEAAAAELERRRIGSRHVLVELEADTPAGAVEVTLERLGSFGLLPVFAHPERCRAVRSQPHLLDLARSAGALVQVVAPSLSGRWGEGAAEAGWRLIGTARADLLASDAHRAEQVGHLVEALDRISARYGDEARVALTETGPARLLSGSPERV
jgi:protein-tyrosine phosphatase